MGSIGNGWTPEWEERRQKRMAAGGPSEEEVVPVSDTVIAPDLREAYERTDPDGFSTWTYPASHTHKLIERVSKAEQENAALRAKVAKLEAPVSDEEWQDAQMIQPVGEDCCGSYMCREQIDALIAARGREGE